MLRSWYYDDESIEHYQRDLLEPSVVSSMAEHIDAYHRGLPFSRMILHVSNARRHYYADGIVAWVDGDNWSTVGLYYLATGERNKLRTPNLEKIHEVRVNTSLVAALTSSAGKAYVWSLSHPQSPPMSIQLESALENSILIAEQTVAIFHVKTHSVTVFNASTGEYLFAPKSYSFTASSRDLRQHLAKCLTFWVFCCFSDVPCDNSESGIIIGATKSLIFKDNHTSTRSGYALNWDAKSIFYLERCYNPLARGNTGADERRFVHYDLQVSKCLTHEGHSILLPYIDFNLVRMRVSYGKTLHSC